MTGPRIGELCAGYGGLGMGVQAVLGGSLAWVSEYEPPSRQNPNPSQGAARILAHRFPDVPNHGDMTRIDWSQVEPVDVLTGGTPCQDLSHAGKRRGMTEGTRSNLWVAMREAVAQLRPSLVVWENVRGAYSAEADSELESREGRLGVLGDGPILRALGRVLGDLSSLGFDAEWCGLRASDVGAPHGRFRVFVIAWPATDAEDGRPPSLTGGIDRGELSTARSDAGWVSERNRAGTGHRTGEWSAAQGVPVMGRGASEVATDAERGGRDGRPGELRPGRRAEPAHSGGRTAADASGDGRHEGRPESARLQRGPHAALSGAGTPTHADLAGLEGRGVVHDGRRTERPPRQGRLVDWGPYTAAVRRWERVTGRPAPTPTEPGKNGQPRLSPAFVEWMMGLPAGWVTDVPRLSRNDQLKALGNGVVPQQAAHALRLLLPDAARATA